MLSDSLTPVFSVSCPAKINWFLNVCPPRPDGYHPLQTVMQAVNLYDRIECVPRPDGRIVCVDAAKACCCPPDRSTVARAAQLLRDACDTASGVTLTIHKSIPVGAGLGGGSSDAAATLRLLSRLWRCSLSQPDLHAIALRVGADVPFFLGSPAAYCTGVGDVLTPLAPGLFHIVLWKPQASLATSDVYARFDQAQRPRRKPDCFLDAYTSGNPAALAQQVWNNLALAALECMPALSGMLDAARQAGARAAWISGSGPTVVCLCDDASSAARLYAALRRQAGPGDFLHHGTTLANPVPALQV